MRKWFDEKISSSNKRTILFISLSVFFILLAYQITLFCCGMYFNSNSDDVVQYSPILIQYINYFKEGNFSLYNFSNNLGASIFADAYYVPLDVFSLIIFLLSFVMDATIAFSTVNLSKVLFGVIVFAYFLQRKGFKNWIVVLLSFMYFAFGGCWIFSVFPTYFSLYFYLPLSLLVLDYYNKGKKWLMPLYSFVLVLYNFYNAYALFWFMAFVFIVVKIRDDYVSFKKLVKEVIVFGLQLALGVLMAFAVFLPSVLYILNYGSRTGEVADTMFNFSDYLRMLSKLFMYETGVTTFMMSGGYIKGSFNLYIGTYNLIVLAIMFTMKDRNSKIYKYTLLCVSVMMVIPLFSMIFSGVATAYTRWFNFLNVILLYMVGYMLNNYDFNSFNKNQIAKSIAYVSGLYVIALVIYIVWFAFVGVDSAVEYKVMLAQIIYLMLFGIPLFMNIFFIVSKKRDLVYSILGLEMLIAICINFSVSIEGANLSYISTHNELNSVIDKLEVDEDSLERVYLKDGMDINRSRYLSSLTNEISFHSFFTKHIYDYLNLYDVDNEGLRQTYLNVLNPYSSRIMDYKYIVVKKGDNLGKLDFWEECYQDDNYIVYINNRYEPFYVYEDYYLLEESTLKEEGNNFAVDMQLFGGVILDEDNLNLNKLEYNNIVTEKVELIKKVKDIEIEDNRYELDVSRFAGLGYESKYVYVSYDDLDVSIKVEKLDGLVNQCEKIANAYSCEISDESKKIVVEGNISGLKYTYIVEVEDEKKTLSFVQDPQGKKYFNYSIKSEYEIVLKDKQLETKNCFYGMCILDDFEVDHLLSDETNFIFGDKELYLYYFYDNLDYYTLNSKDNFASNKELTYDGSTVNVKYHRDSASDYDQVVVLPITYSEEWVIEDNDNYELVKSNGGFLGVVVKNGIRDIDVDITFKPTGVKTGLVGSAIGMVIYGIYCTITCVKRKKENNENT